jgi:hypothetical protein
VKVPTADDDSPKGVGAMKRKIFVGLLMLVVAGANAHAGFFDDGDILITPAERKRVHSLEALAWEPLAARWI